MLSLSASATRRLGPYLLAAPLLVALTLTFSCSQKLDNPLPGQAASQPLKVSNALVYIDGQRQDSTALRQLRPQDIASVNVVKGEEARAYDPQASAPGILMVTTKQNEHRPDVVAFNARQHLGRAATADDLNMRMAQLPASAAYFLNGQPSTREAIAGLDPKAITRTDVLRGAEASALAHDANVQLAIAVLAN